MRTDRDKAYTYQTQEKPYCQSKVVSIFVREVLLPQNTRITSQNNESAEALQPVCSKNTSSFTPDPCVPKMSYVKSPHSANACVYSGATALLLLGMGWVYLLFQKTCGAMAYKGGTVLLGLVGGSCSAMTYPDVTTEEESVSDLELLFGFKLSAVLLLGLSNASEESRGIYDLIDDLLGL